MSSAIGQSGSDVLLWLLVAVWLCSASILAFWMVRKRPADLKAWLRWQIVSTRTCLTSTHIPRPRFGIRGLMVLIAVTSALLAAMAQWRMLGACVALSVLLGAVLALGVVAEYGRFAKKSWDRVQSLERYLSASLMPLIVWFSAVSLLAGGTRIWVEYYNQWQLERHVQMRLRIHV